MTVADPPHFEPVSRSDLDAAVATLRADVERMHGGIRADVERMHGDTRADVGELRGEVRAMRWTVSVVGVAIAALMLILRLFG